MAETEELWELTDENGRSLHKLIRRGAPHAAGTYHRVIGVWVLDSSGRALVTRRHPQKEQYPNLWENVGGCVCAGEQSLETAVRELWEETGLAVEPEELTLLGTLKEQTALADIYVLVTERVNLGNLQLQDTEVTRAWMVTRPEWEEMIKKNIVSPAALRRMRAVEPKLEALGFRA